MTARPGRQGGHNSLRWDRICSYGGNEPQTQAPLALRGIPFCNARRYAHLAWRAPPAANPLPRWCLRAPWTPASLPSSPSLPVKTFWTWAAGPAFIRRQTYAARLSFAHTAHVGNDCSGRCLRLLHCGFPQIPSPLPEQHLHATACLSPSHATRFHLLPPPSSPFGMTVGGRAFLFHFRPLPLLAYTSGALFCGM